MGGARIAGWLLGVLALALAAAPAAAAGAGRGGLPPVGHVFVLLLENQAYADMFAEGAKAPFLGHTLPGQGALLRQYHAIGHSSLPNYIALISGQAPNRQTQLDCTVYSEFPDDPRGAG